MCWPALGCLVVGVGGLIFPQAPGGCPDMIGAFLDGSAFIRELPRLLHVDPERGQGLYPMLDGPKHESGRRRPPRVGQAPRLVLPESGTPSRSRAFLSRCNPTRRHFWTPAAALIHNGPPPNNNMPGPLSRFFAADHRRLDALLRDATRDPGHVDLGPYGEFRAGLLKHIAMEEKVLFPVALRQGADPEFFSRLRVDHGAIASLLVPTPTPMIVSDLLSVLTPHNHREEEPQGGYETCDDALEPAEAERLLTTLRAFPEVKLKNYRDTTAVFRHIEINLDLSRKQWS